MTVHVERHTLEDLRKGKPVERFEIPSPPAVAAEGKPEKPKIVKRPTRRLATKGGDDAGDR